MSIGLMGFCYFYLNFIHFIFIIIQMYKIHIFIVVSLLSSSALCLHLLDNTQAQIDALKTQQDNF